MGKGTYDALLASIATALGVSPFACTPEPSPVGPTPAVSAREVSPWTAPVSPETNAGPPVLPGDADDAAVVTAPPDDAGVAPAVEWKPVPLSWLTAIDPTPPPPRSIPKVCTTGLGCQPRFQPGGSCGGTARPPQELGAPRGPRLSGLRLGLKVRAGLSAEQADRAAQALAGVRAQVGACVQRAVQNGLVPASTQLTVVARAPGAGAPASFTPSIASDVSPPTCLDEVLPHTIGGDEKPAQLVFRVAVDVDK